MKALCRLAVILALSLWATSSYADGGALLLHQDAGPFTISLFAAPLPLATGVNELSVVVQQRGDGEVLLDPVIDIVATPGDAGDAVQTVRLVQGSSPNRLLQSATVRLPRPGRWRLRVQVHRGTESAEVSTECLVEQDRSRVAIVWFYTLLPVVVILIFLLHQWVRHKQQRK